jgi:hypothetical protein
MSSLTTNKFKGEKDMAKKTIKTTGNLESRVTILEARLAALEQMSKKFNRKTREYTDEQRAAIHKRLLAGQEAARKRRDDDVKVISVEKPTTEAKKVVKSKPAPAKKHS